MKLLWNICKGTVIEITVKSRWSKSESIIFKLFPLLTLLTRMMTTAEVGLPGIGARVYQNMLRWYRVCVEVAGRHTEPFL